MTKIWRPICLMVVLALVLSLGAALLPFGGNVQAAGGTYYVDASVGGPGTGTSVDPWKTITLALATVPGGDPNNPDVINVAAGTYDAANGETFPLTFSNDGVSLVGADATTTTIDGETALTILDIDDTGITIQDFTITNSTSDADYGIEASDSDGGFSVLDNTFTNVDYGVYLYISELDYTGDYTVDDILISGNEFNPNDYGVYLDIGLDFDATVTGLTATIGDIDILDNTFNMGTYNAIDIEEIYVTDINSGSISVGDIDISRNEMYDGQDGIDFYGYFGGSSLDYLTDTTVTVGDVTINNNILQDQTSDAISIDYYDALYWDGTTTGTFGDLVINGNDITSTASPDGIYIDDLGYWDEFYNSASLTVGALYIEGNEIDVGGYGISIYYYDIEDLYDNSEVTTGNIRIEDNVIDASSEAIYLYYDYVAYNMEDDAVLLMGDVYIVDNQISGDDDGIYLYYSSYDVGTDMIENAYAELPDYIITGNTFNVSGDGIYFYTSNNPDDNLGNSTVDFGGFLIDDNVFNDEDAGMDYGIYLYYDDIGEDIDDNTVTTIGDVTITNNKFYDLDEDAIYIFYGELGYDLEEFAALEVGDLVIADNVIDGAIGNGIHVLYDEGANTYDDSSVTVGMVDISRNTISNVSGEAIYLEYDMDSMGVYNDSTQDFGNIVIADNVIDDADYGIEVYYNVYSDDSTLTMGILDITGNDISNVDSDGIYLYYWLDAANDSTLTVGRALIEENTIDGSGGDGIYISDVYLDSDIGAEINFENITITTNTISGNDDGVYISSMDEDYLVVVGPCNDIVGNSGYGVNNDSGYMVDATENWWGDDSGPGGEGPGTGDAVSEDVDYRPWRTLPCGEEEEVEVEAVVGGPGPALIPPILSVQSVRIEPIVDVYPGQEVRIYVEVVNDGGDFGRMMVNVMINGELDQSQVVEVSPGSVQRVYFYTYRTAPGAYTVTIEDVSAQFSVMSPPQAPPPPPPSPVFQPVDEGLGTGGIIALVVIGILGLAGIIIAFRVTRRA